LIVGSIRAKRPINPKPASPRRYQSRAIDAAENHFIRDKASRGRLIAPCGTGKSLLGFWTAERLKAKTVAVIVPNLGLIEQGSRDWMKEFRARAERQNQFMCAATIPLPTKTKSSAPLLISDCR
jgi:predicted helicase